MRGSGRRSATRRWKPTAQSTSAAASEPTIITSSPIVLITRASSGSVCLDVLDEALDGVDRLLLARLLGQARVAGQVGEGDRHAQAARGRAAASSRSASMCPIDVLLDEVRQEALVHVVHDRRGERQQLAGELLHLLGHLQPGHAVAHQRLVHVEVEEAHLGVGHLRERLPVDAHELQEARRAGSRRSSTAATWRSSSRSSSEIRSSASALKPIERNRRSISAGSRPVSRGRLARACARPRAPGSSSSTKPKASRPLSLAAPDLVERVAALAQARDDARLGHRRRRPASVARVRHEAVPRPARERLRGDADAARRLAAGR